MLNIVPGGREVGAYLVAHPGVDKVAFTGSTAAGRAIAETCGRLLRPVTLELGGKSAAIVLDDADLDLATIGEDLFAATLLNNGQTCFLGTRVLAPRSRYDEVVDVFSAFAGAMAVGDALDAGHPDRSDGQRAPARPRRGLHREGPGRGRPDHRRRRAPRGPDEGWFVEPTVFADVDNNATIAQEEIFGPVLSVIPYDDEDDASASPTTPTTASAAPSGPPTPSAASPSPRGSTPARSGSTATCPTRPRRSAASRPAASAASSAPRASPNYQHLKSVYC